MRLSVTLDIDDEQIDRLVRIHSALRGVCDDMPWRADLHRQAMLLGKEIERLKATINEHSRSREGTKAGQGI